jgi:hypothetical protein
MHAIGAVTSIMYPHLYNTTRVSLHAHTYMPSHIPDLNLFANTFLHCANAWTLSSATPG